MDWSKSAPFGAIKERLAWLDQRQTILARNIANADTPGYVPHDLKPLNFRETLRDQVAPVSLSATNPAHLPGLVHQKATFRDEVQRDADDVSPSGNAVDLEQQMAKVNESAATHRLTTQLYRKYLDMIHLAATSKN
ncbi:MAG: flagellar basal body rod protein FlgB [Rhodospirillales bacterium]|nr:flagellar basal body rod protein FlgB [Rhodospirillales bacterium]